jgi:hypothetical protein
MGNPIKHAVTIARKKGERQGIGKKRKKKGKVK